MTMLCKDVTSYYTCLLCDFTMGTLLWKVSQILSPHGSHLKTCFWVTRLMYIFCNCFVSQTGDHTIMELLPKLCPFYINHISYFIILTSHIIIMLKDVFSKQTLSCTFGRNGEKGVVKYYLS